MEKFNIPIPANVLRIASPNPYLVLRNFGLEYLQKSIFRANMGEPLKDKNGNPYPNQEVNIPKSEYTSRFGTPIFGELLVEDGFYYDEKGNRVEYEGLLLECALFEVSMSKNIVKTAIQGLGGDIKEFISDGDFQINIKGVICSEIPNDFPFAEMKKLVEVFKSSASLSVKSKVLNDTYGIYDIVIESFNMPDSGGFFNMQKYEINCVSDTPVEIRLKNEED